jgi:hypothetical protein
LINQQPRPARSGHFWSFNMQNQTKFFPFGLAEKTIAAWGAAVGAGQRAWLEKVGGLRMSHITSEPSLAAALTDKEAAESDALFGLGYVRLLDLMAWPLDVDETHPFLFQRVSEATPEHIKLIEKISDRATAQGKIIDRTARRYARTMPLLMGHSDRTLLLSMANQAPTDFALGLAVGWLVLCDWRESAQQMEEQVLA